MGRSDLDLSESSDQINRNISVSVHLGSKEGILDHEEQDEGRQDNLGEVCSRKVVFNLPHNAQLQLC